MLRNKSRAEDDDDMQRSGSKTKGIFSEGMSLLLYPRTAIILFFFLPAAFPMFSQVTALFKSLI